jgi:hypothetical protein
MEKMWFGASGIHACTDVEMEARACIVSLTFIQTKKEQSLSAGIDTYIHIRMHTCSRGVGTTSCYNSTGKEGAMAESGNTYMHTYTRAYMIRWSRSDKLLPFCGLGGPCGKETTSI